jgi:two-component system sensor histidine kinase KdpD
VRESEALKTSLLRAVSHDLRTPLTAIRLEVESLARRLAGRPEAADSLRTLGREQERLARRIDNLLALARLDAGLARPHPEAVPPSSLFRAAGESLAGVLDGRAVEVRIAPRCPDVWADPSLALESLVNLLENAARAAPADAPIELAAALGPGAPGRVFLEVRDRGPGVPASALRRLQNPREPRAAPGAGDTAAGGLGLQIAGSFAQADGGSLELLARPGGGTVARLDLPAAAEPPADAEEET